MFDGEDRDIFEILHIYISSDSRDDDFICMQHPFLVVGGVEQKDAEK